MKTSKTEQKSSVFAGFQKASNMCAKHIRRMKQQKSNFLI